jgi:hypothetical protein
MVKIKYNKLIYVLLFLPIIGLLYFLFPELSYAWGPGVHVKAGLEVVKNIYNIAPAIADIITKYPYYYLYGCISPDIIIGKKFTKEIDHCHNWEVGRTIFNDSGDDTEVSFSYGYLSHLAADVVAHNYFVPNQIVGNFIARTLRHTYWEMRFDGLMNDEVWDVFNKIPKNVRTRSNKRLKNILTTTIFPFSMNKRIFNGIMHISSISKWQEMIRSVSDSSQWILTKRDVGNYYRLTLQNIFELLKENEVALCMKADPNGKESLKIAKKIRRDLRIFHKRGNMSDYDCHRIINELKPRFIKKMTTREKSKHTIKIKSKKKKKIT